MTHRYAQIAFTDDVRRQQSERGSRRAYARMEQGPAEPDVLGPAECGFITTRDSFYLASTGATGWPYVQHRGGQPGFLRVLDPGTLAFPDYRGNRQYITVGNLDDNDRVALLLMDYPQRARLKIYGRAQAVTGADIADARTSPDGIVERLIVISVHAYDWNCQQHIRPRYTEQEVAEAVGDLRVRLGRLERENRLLRERLGE